jgi:hypothetical protein
MQTTTPRLNNLTPQTGRMVNEEDEIHNIVDDYGSLKTVDRSHSAVHEGVSFTFSGSATNIATAGVVRFLGRTGDVTAHLWSFFIKADQAPMTIEFFEAPTVSDPGTAQTPLNRNRQSTTAPTLQVYVNPTVSADGTRLLIDNIFGEQKTVTSETLEGEWLLKKNTDYMFKITNLSNQAAAINAGFNWLEQD